MDEEQRYADSLNRWDLHTDRQMAAAKGGVAAITLLSSGSWIALLSQAGQLSTLPSAADNLPVIMWLWGLGAFFGTITWLFIYFSTLALFNHDFERGRRMYAIAVDATRHLGLLSVILSLASFLGGLWNLAELLN